ncbi:PRA1 family protein 3 [Halotydeus destructor]|nr:PRA1 family protein 3 [Halotydeus destructor]
MENVLSQDLQVAPLRKLDDFLMDGARFNFPDFKDLERVNHRVTANLLYYQTNYFIAFFFLFILIGLFAPGKLIFGMFATAFAIALFIYLANQKDVLRQFKVDHPVLTSLGVFGLSYVFVWLFDCSNVFLLATLLPLVLMFTHAMIRKRNVKNKINEKLDAIGLKKTPMGLALDFLGQQFDKLE